MYFDEEHIGTRCQGRPSHRRNLVAQPGAMRRIRGHWHMRKLGYDGNRRNVERIARVSFERANAALAKNHVVISAGHNVLGRKQQFLKGRSDATLKHYRLLYLA